MTRLYRIAFILFLATPGRMAAQAVSGTIFGFVQDASHAAVPEAHVTVRNTQTGYERSGVTAADGGYSFASLPIGPTRLTVQKEGFHEFVQEGIVLQVDQRARLDVVLQIGAVSEEVRVTAEAPLVNEANAETSAVIDRQRVDQLPLNGRNFVQLIQLTTGTTPGAPGDTQNNLVINLFRGPTFFTANGMRNMYNNFILDGVDNNENAFNAGGIVILPVVDAIQEFKVATGNFSSEFGRAAGGVVNVQTRGGTNALHGDVFEFFRNSSLDANDFFNNANGAARPPFRQNQFGATLGGPIRRNSLFFFIDYQGLRQRRGLTYLASVATPAMRAGDFSGSAFPTIYDPLTTRANGGSFTRDPFAGQKIPANRIDPAAPQFLAFMPLPNTNPNGIALNFINNPKWIRNDNQGDARIDKNLGKIGSLFGRYSNDQAFQFFPNELTTPQNPFGGGGRTNNLDIAAQSVVLNFTHLAKANLVMEHRFGFSRFNFQGRTPGANSPLVSQVQIPGSHISDAANVIPGVSIPGLTGLGFAAGGLPNFSVENTFQYVFNVTWTRGRHALKTGWDVRRRQRNNFINSAPPAGSFSFSQATTNQTGAGAGGVGMASFLLGIPSGIQQGFVQGGVGRRNSEWSAYVQDDFKVTSNFTLNLGVRYELYTPMTEVANRLSILDFATGHLILPGTNGPYGRGLMRNDKHDFAPRAGFAWRVPGSAGLVVRGGYGISYIQEFGANTFNEALNSPYAFIQNLTYSTIQPPAVRLSTGIPSPGPIDINNPFGQIRMVDPLVRSAYAQQWDLTVQKELGRNWLVEAGYVGTKGTHLLIGTDGDQPVPGPGAIANRRPLFAVAPNVTNGLAKSIGDSVYHSLQMKVEKRLSHGFYLLGSYTLSKDIDDSDGNFSDGVPGVGSFGTPQNVNNLRGERGLASTDQRNRFVGSYGWELPFAKRKKWGGWQISGITTISSGSPFDLLFSPSTLNTGTSQRPDRIAGGTLAHPTLIRYFDTSAFAAPAAFVFGNAGRNVLIGPGVNTWDASVIKDTQFSERYRLQFRTDFFNLANRPQFNPPGNTIGTPQAGQISSTRFSTNRQIQFVLKLYF